MSPDKVDVNDVQLEDADSRPKTSDAYLNRPMPDNKNPTQTLNIDPSIYKNKQ